MAINYPNLLSRVLVAVVAVPAVLLISYHGGILFFLFVSLISCFALNEFYAMAALKGASVQRALGIVAVIMLNASFFLKQLISALFGGQSLLLSIDTVQIFFIVLALFFICVLTVELFRNKGSVLTNAGATILGVVYIGAFLSTLIGIRELFGSEFPLRLVRESLNGINGLADDSARGIAYDWGGVMVIAILASIWICDTAAYFGGLATGKHKLFVRVSPNKTWEGSAWGFFGAVGTMIVAQRFYLPYLHLHQALIIGGVVGVFGQIGDLVESLFKRDAGVKDSSNMIPGHGGVFDRFDSLIFVSPILYLYLRYFALS
ncbi:MAG TPA: phosphatidate cytidylyltransferase [Bacteroidota bacterium]|nr:phosphatidate cytidylyltransferase [Bacteroidota bacterium]